MFVWQPLLPEDWVITTWQLPDNCLTTSQQFPDNCLTIAWQLHDNCVTIAWQLHDNCLKTAWQLPDNCLTTFGSYLPPQIFPESVIGQSSLRQLQNSPTCSLSQTHFPHLHFPFPLHSIPSLIGFFYETSWLSWLKLWVLKANVSQEILNWQSLRHSHSADICIHFYCISWLTQARQRKMIQSSALWLCLRLCQFKISWDT